VAFFRSLGILALFIEISSSLDRTGVVASPPNFKILPGTPSGPTDLILPIYAKILL